MKQFFFILIAGLWLPLTGYAGNPDRQGEAGAYELLLNPWARSAGLHTMNTASVTGVEALRLNVAGMVRVRQLEVVLGHANYLQGTDIRMNALGLSRKVGENGAFGFSVMSMDFGDIEETTTLQPEGTGSTFSPNFFNIGVGYSHIFENKVSVGIAFRVISESLSNVSALGFAIDAGVQYVTGPEDNFKFGIALRNVGSPMRYSGEGLSEQRPAPNGGTYEITLDQRSASFELPSMLHIGLAYDFRSGEHHRITALGNFTSNSFSRDQLGAGVEYALRETFMLRAAYKLELGERTPIEDPIYTGLSAGASISFPVSKKNKDTRFGLDYAYRATKVWDGTHNIGLRISL